MKPKKSTVNPNAKEAIRLLNIIKKETKKAVEKGWKGGSLLVSDYNTMNDLLNYTFESVEMEIKEVSKKHEGLKKKLTILVQDYY